MSDPVSTRRRLRVELRRLRSEAGLTQREVAASLGWAPSKIIRIESGSVAVDTSDLAALLSLYRVRDELMIDALGRMAATAEPKPFSRYREIVSPDTVKYFGYETSASVIRQFEPLALPGLLQTAEYTRALLTAYDILDDKADLHLTARRERQQLLARENPPEVFFVVDESVLLRPIGGRAVMTAQLQHILRIADHPRITFQVLPFTIGAHAGLRGPFTLLEFPDVDDPNVLYLESRLGGDRTFVDEPELASRYQEIFWRLEDQGSRPGELDRYVDRAMTALMHST